MQAHDRDRCEEDGFALPTAAANPSQNHHQARIGTTAHNHYSRLSSFLQFHLPKNIKTVSAETFEHCRMGNLFAHADSKTTTDEVGIDNSKFKTKNSKLSISVNTSIGNHTQKTQTKTEQNQPNRTFFYTPANPSNNPL
ncbi:MAG: hypothetical protein ACYSWP_07660 [Planctomycetota bacterium]|jgi:hypothetical protein